MAGNKKICKKLVEKGANINIGDLFGHTALHAAIHYGNNEIIELLL